MLKIYDRFTPRANAADTDYPFGSFKNETIPGARDGTPLNADWANDHEGFDTALLAEADITPSGLPDTAIASQRLDALKSIGNTSYSIKRSSVADMLSTGAALPDGAEIKTLSYNSQVVDSYWIKSSTTPTGGFYLSSGGTHYLYVRKSATPFIGSYGSDGVAENDTKAIENFIADGGGKLWLGIGRVVSLSRPITAPSTLSEFKILATASTVYASTTFDTMFLSNATKESGLDGVTLDGAGVCNRGFISVSPVLDVRNGVIKNLYQEIGDANPCMGVQGNDSTRMTVTGMHFLNLKAEADGVPSSGDGTVRAIRVFGQHANARIYNCKFENIICVSGGFNGTQVFDDADAIVQQTRNTSETQRCTIKDNEFINIGKRWLKIQTSAASVTKFDDNYGTGWGDYAASAAASELLTKGQNSIITVQSGTLKARRNEFREGYCTFFISANAESDTLVKVVIKDTDYEPTYSPYVGLSRTRPYIIAGGASTVIDIDGCDFTKSELEATISGKTLRYNGNSHSQSTTTVSITIDGYAVVSNNLMQGDNNTLGASFLVTKALGVTGTGNIIDTMLDGFNLSSALNSQASFYMALVGNSVTNYGRQPLQVNTTLTTNIIEYANAKTGTSAQRIKVSTQGSAGAIASYKQEYVNGTLYRIPLHAIS